MGMFHHCPIQKRRPAAQCANDSAGRSHVGGKKGEAERDEEKADRNGKREEDDAEEEHDGARHLVRER